MGLNEGDSDHFFTKAYAKYTSDSEKAHVGSPLQYFICNGLYRRGKYPTENYSRQIYRLIRC